MSKQQDQQVKKKRETTKHYDELCSKIRRILAAGITYMGDLCDALKEDWYPHLTIDMIQRDPDLRAEIRDKILDDWSKERNNEGEWKSSYIMFHLRDWVKDPEQIESGKKGGKASAQARSLQKFEGKVKEVRTKLDKVADLLPELPKEPEKEDEEIGSIVDDDPMFRGLGDSGKSAITMYGKIFGPVQDLIEGLIDQRHIPMPDEDRFNGYIKPTRDRFLSMYHELDEEHYKTSLYNAFVFTKELLEDRIKLMNNQRGR